MRIFLTGGSGFLGTSFINYILTHEDSSQIKTLSRSSISDEKILNACKGIEDGKDRIKIIRGSTHDEDAIKEGLNGVDIVIHMAAKVQPWGIYEEFQKNNVEGTRRLLSIIESMPHKPRLIYTSSFTALINRHFSEDTIPDWAPYSKSKFNSEYLVRKSSLTDVIILRLGWLWGKNDSVLLPKLYSLCMNPAWKVTPASYPLSTLHIDNACESIYLACKISKDQVSADTTTTGDTTPPKKVYEIEDPEGEIEMEDFVESYVGTAYNIKPPRPFKNFRLPRWLVWGTITAVEWIPFLGYGRKWVMEGMSREPLLCLFKDYRLQTESAVKELGYVGKVSRKQGLAELAAELEVGAPR
ncbi:13197_t:CDS:2 [Acaulospora colombiana]|uniref:13197_t:CDS:1 n=1 Tax=Acaulospora colombiana TaxID=27376 RepID=A0ACA9LCK3_9GLOM|nr:13197_t:CDS:2 [Acaulospora colombiana]